MLWDFDLKEADRLERHNNPAKWAGSPLKSQYKEILLSR
jgi:hypothetical protein